MSDTLSPAEVAALRHLLGVSQVELTGMLGMGEGTVRRWESGRQRPSPASVERVWELVDEHDRLVRRYLYQDGPIGIIRDQDHYVGRPRAWYLSAAGQALRADPDISIDWA